MEPKDTASTNQWRVHFLRYASIAMRGNVSEGDRSLATQLEGELEIGDVVTFADGVCTTLMTRITSADDLGLELLLTELFGPRNVPENAPHFENGAALWRLYIISMNFDRDSFIAIGPGSAAEMRCHLAQFAVRRFGEDVHAPFTSTVRKEVIECIRAGIGNADDFRDMALLFGLGGHIPWTLTEVARQREPENVATCIADALQRVRDNAALSATIRRLTGRESRTRRVA